MAATVFSSVFILPTSKYGTPKCKMVPLFIPITMVQVLTMQQQVLIQMIPETGICHTLLAAQIPMFFIQVLTRYICPPVHTSLIGRLSARFLPDHLAHWQIVFCIVYLR